MAQRSKTRVAGYESGKYSFSPREPRVGSILGGLLGATGGENYARFQGLGIILQTDLKKDPTWLA